MERFKQRKGCYKSVGKAWKRGHLLFGPPNCSTSWIGYGRAVGMKGLWFEQSYSDGPEAEAAEFQPPQPGQVPAIEDGVWA
ncbi:hypothetical protein V6N13_118890 [Hibiscus sabdariffa]